MKRGLHTSAPFTQTINIHVVSIGGGFATPSYCLDMHTCQAGKGGRPAVGLQTTQPIFPTYQPSVLKFDKDQARPRSAWLNRQGSYKGGRHLLDDPLPNSLLPSAQPTTSAARCPCVCSLGLLLQLFLLLSVASLYMYIRNQPPCTCRLRVLYVYVARLLMTSPGGLCALLLS